MTCLTPMSHAYAPPATTVVAERALAALPRSARASLAGPELSLALASLADRSERDPEGSEPSRLVPAASLGVGVTSEGTPQAPEGAFAEFQSARDALSGAFRRSDRMAVAEAIARMSQAAADLADPYRSLDGSADEVDGARAWFDDALEPTALAGVRGDLGHTLDPLALALSAAEARVAADEAVTGLDDAAVRELREHLLSDAAALVAASVRSAWRPVAATGPAFRIGPEPMRGSLTLFVALEAAGAARLELFDVAGRRLRDQDLGVLPAGESVVAIPAAWSEGLASGVYLARVSAGGMRNERRVTRVAD